MLTNRRAVFVRWPAQPANAAETRGTSYAAIGERTRFLPADEFFRARRLIAQCA
jgi:hypothetical protein